MTSEHGWSHTATCVHQAPAFSERCCSHRLLQNRGLNRAQTASLLLRAQNPGRRQNPSGGLLSAGADREPGAQQEKLPQTPAGEPQNASEAAPARIRSAVGGRQGSTAIQPLASLLHL